MASTQTTPAVKIVRFQLEPDGLAAAEREVSELLRQGWRIATAGGAGGGYGGNHDDGAWGVLQVVGFIVLQKE